MATGVSSFINPFVISGHTSGSILSQRFQFNGTIISYSLVDKGSGSNVTIAIVTAGDQVYIATQTLTAGEMFDQSININVNQGSELLVISSAPIDYYFSFSS